MNTNIAEIGANPETQEDYLLQQTQEVSANIPIDSNVNQNVQLEWIQHSIPKLKPHCYAFICAIRASAICILLGLSVGVMSEPATHFEKDKRMTERQLEFMTMVLHILSLIGSAMAGCTSDRIGRRGTILLAGGFSFFGTILMSFITNNALLLFGRALSQVGVGFAPMIAIVYIAELCPASSRGALTSLPEVFINLSTIIGYIINYNSSKIHPNFGRLAMLTLGACSLVVLTTRLFAMPESPAWLVMQGRLADALVILIKTSNSVEEARLRLDRLKEAANIPAESNQDIVPVPQSSGEGVWRDLHPTLSVRYMLVSAVTIHLLEQGCGMDTLLLYTPRIFEKVGVTSYNEKLLLNIKLHVVKTLVSFIPTIFLDWFGRKGLLLCSVGGMIVSLAILGTGLTGIDQSDMKPKWAVTMCVPSLFSCVVFYSIGLGPIPLVYSSELFPLRLRAQGDAISLGAKQFLSAVMAMGFFWVYEAITLGGAIFGFMAITILGFLCIYKAMPETRGKTMEEMWGLFTTLTPQPQGSPQSDIELQRIGDPTVHGTDTGPSA